jgi:hypothetical protein
MVARKWESLGVVVEPMGAKRKKGKKDSDTI